MRNKVAIVEKPGKLVIREIAIPEPGDYDALCEILVGGTCPGTDLHIINGIFYGDDIKYPVVLGHESVGVVIKTGTKVKHLKEGDLVLKPKIIYPGEIRDGIGSAWAEFAEYGLVKDFKKLKEDYPEKDTSAFEYSQLLPEDISYSDAAMMMTWIDTLHWLTALDNLFGKTICIIGSGVNALSFIKFSKLLYAKKIICIGSIKRKEQIENFGADEFVDYKEDIGKVLAEFKGKIEIILDAVGEPSTLNQILPLVSSGGKFTIFGLNNYNQMNVNITSVKVDVTYRFTGDKHPVRVYPVLLDMIKNKLIKGKDFFSESFSFDELPKAYKLLEERKGLKYLINISPRVKDVSPKSGEILSRG